MSPAYYDRVLVMDSGGIAELDTVLNLFDKEDSIFRSLCNEANLQRADILRIRTDHNAGFSNPSGEFELATPVPKSSEIS